MREEVKSGEPESDLRRRTENYKYVVDKVGVMLVARANFMTEISQTLTHLEDTELGSKQEGLLEGFGL